MNALLRPFALLALLFAALPGTAQDYPEEVVDPEVAMKDWRFHDPVFMWRLMSQPENIYEPPDWFYWPNAVIEGTERDFLPAARAGERTIPTATLEAMAQWSLERQSNALIVIHKGKVQYEQYWNGTKADDLLNGRAITRSITPIALGYAVEDGKLALDDPIRRYIYEWEEDPRGSITVRQLAQNTSGLEVAEQYSSRRIADNKDLCLVYCGDVVRAALQYDYVTEPGTKFEVAQENMQLLALVVERATGRPIQKLLSEKLWQPMGGADATFQFDRPDGVARTMCCMRATARDWTRIGVILAQGGKWGDKQVIPANWLATMTSPSPRNPNFGLGLWLGNPFNPMRTYFEDQPGVIPQSEPFLADDVRIMEGGGFRVVYSVPSEELVIFRHGPWVDNWDGSYLVNTAIAAIREDAGE